MMAFFDDMTAALATYPVTDVALEIVDVVISGNVLNVTEEATFKVKVTNNGPLNLTGVTLRIKGQHGATLRGPGIIFTPPPAVPRVAAGSREVSPFVDEFVSGVLPTIFAHGGSQTSDSFTLKAPESAQASQTLIKATLEAWDANLDHILNGHSDPLPNAPSGTFAAVVVQS
jgi:hypothetical protein